MPLVLFATVFWVGYFTGGPFFWLHWAGFTGLFYLYQERRRGNFGREFLLPCWGLFLAVYSGCFYWLYVYDGWVCLFIVLVFSLFFPLFFFLHRSLTLKVRSPVVGAAAVFGIFLALEYALSRVPAMESIGLDLFFQPPAAVLCILKFISFKVWSAWVFAACFAAACCARERNARSFVLLGVLIGGLAALFLVARTQNGNLVNGTGRAIRIALIQHNLPYSELWRTDHPVEVKEKYREMARKAALGAPDLIIFPLYNFPEDLYREPDFLKELAVTVKRPILIASHVPINAGDAVFDQGFMNFAFLYGPDGKAEDIYQAVASLPFLGQVVKLADKYRVMRGPFGKLGVLLCYEDMIPRLSRAASEDGAGVLVALSNPGLFQGTVLLEYHLFQDQIRAAETGLPLIRVSSNGYSALIDRAGRVVQKTKLDAEEILQVELPGSSAVRHGVSVSA